MGRKRISVEEVLVGDIEDSLPIPDSMSVFDPDSAVEEPEETVEEPDSDFEPVKAYKKAAKRIRYEKLERPLRENCILHGIPVPAKSRSGKWIDLASKMKPGDCVMLASKESAAMLRLACKKLSINAVVRHTDKGYGVWVIE